MELGPSALDLLSDSVMDRAALNDDDEEELEDEGQGRLQSRVVQS